MPSPRAFTRIEDRLSGTAFSDFVRQGAGAATVKRYLDNSTRVSGSGSATTTRGGSRRQAAWALCPADEIQP